MNRVAFTCSAIFFSFRTYAFAEEPFPPGQQFLVDTTLLKKSAVDPLPVSISMELELDGEVVSKPKVIVLIGHKAEITQQEKGTDSSYSIEVFPSLATKPNSLQLSFVIKQNKDGKAKTLGRPQVVVLNGDTATISQQSAELPSLKLRVRPNF